jgi:hypothetical protein
MQPIQINGLFLVISSLLMLSQLPRYHCWRIRCPLVFVIAVYFALGVSRLGVGGQFGAILWVWLRSTCDLALALIVIFSTCGRCDRHGPHF